jgi:DNA-binding MarR family transcriptional regulator
MNAPSEYSCMSMPKSPPDGAGAPADRRRAKQPPPQFVQWRFEAMELVHEIRSTARCLADPLDIEGEPLFPSGALWLLLETLTRLRAVPAIADVARALRVSRQAAHRIVRSAARAGYVELLSNPRDRRILQVRLTDGGRAMLAVARAREAQWAFVMLNGYSLHRLRQISAFLRLLRHRVLTFERERDRDMREYDLGSGALYDHGLGDLME